MLRSIENIKFCSYLQCRWLNVWRVNFYFNTLSCLNYFFPEIMGGVQNGSGNSKGVGGYFSGQKWKLRGGGGPYAKFPPWWGYGYFLELHIIVIFFQTDSCPGGDTWGIWSLLHSFCCWLGIFPR